MPQAGILAIVVIATLVLACHYCGVFFGCGPIEFGAKEKELMLRRESFPKVALP